MSSDEKRVAQLESTVSDLIISFDNQMKATEHLLLACESMEINILSLLQRTYKLELEIERLRCELIQCSQIN